MHGAALFNKVTDGEMNTKFFGRYRKLQLSRFL